MRPSSYYLTAALLVAATVPIYWAILHRSGLPEAPVAAAPLRAREAARAQPSLTNNEANAFKAIDRGLAKCVAGVVYRTFDHVIEPWPGRVRCKQ